jgi:hypothetical protein
MRISIRVILVVAAVLRLGMFAAVWRAPARAMTPDSAGYLQLAANLADEGAFAQDDRPEIFRTPGYPLFLLPGVPFGDAGLRAVLGVQMLIDVLLVYLAYMLAAMLWGRRVGLWAAGFQALAPLAIASSVRLLSDSLFAMLLTLAVLLAVHHLKTRRWWSLVFSAVMFAGACYVRPVGVVACCVVAAMLLVQAGRRVRAAAFAGCVLALLAPWVVRNYVVADYAGFSSFAGDSMYYFSAPEVLARAEGSDIETERQRMRFFDETWQRTSERVPTPGQAADWRRREALDVILTHPLVYAEIHLRGCVGFFLPGIGDALEVLGVMAGQRGTLDVLHRRGPVEAARHYLGDAAWAWWLCGAAIAVLAAKYALCLLCVFGGAPRRMGAGGWLILALVAAAALSGGPAATPRFRVPVEAMLSVLAAGGIAVLTERFARGRQRSAKGGQAEAEPTGPSRSP